MNPKFKRSCRRYLTQKKINKNIKYSLLENIHRVEVEGKLPFQLSNSVKFLQKYKEYLYMEYYIWYLKYSLVLDTEDINILKKCYCPLEGRIALACTHYFNCGDCKWPNEKNRMCDYCTRKIKLKEYYSYLDGEQELTEMGLCNSIRKWNRRNAWSGKL